MSRLIFQFKLLFLGLIRVCRLLEKFAPIRCGGITLDLLHGLSTVENYTNVKRHQPQMLYASLVSIQIAQLQSLAKVVQIWMTYK